MTKRILLFSASIILFSGLISSYDDGPTTCGAGNRTGSQATVANCSGTGCHAANNANTTVLVTMLDSNNNAVTNGWTPGYTYKIILSGTNPTMVEFGYQLSSVFGNGASQVQSGTFSNPQGTAAVKPVGALSIVEHTHPMMINGSAYQAQVNWTAPIQTNIDTVKFYAIVNAVNANNSASGDEANAAMFAFPRIATSVHELSADIKITAYPNPVTDNLNISMQNAERGAYAINVFDMTGKIVSTRTANVSNSYQASINTSTWAAGVYQVQLKKDGAQRTITVMKQ